MKLRDVSRTKSDFSLILYWRTTMGKDFQGRNISLTALHPDTNIVYENKFNNLSYITYWNAVWKWLSKNALLSAFFFRSHKMLVRCWLIALMTLCGSECGETLLELQYNSSFFSILKIRKVKLLKKTGLREICISSTRTYNEKMISLSPTQILPIYG